MSHYRSYYILEFGHFLCSFIIYIRHSQDSYSHSFFVTPMVKPFFTAFGKLTNCRIDLSFCSCSCPSSERGNAQKNKMIITIFKLTKGLKGQGRWKGLIKGVTKGFQCGSELSSIWLCRNYFDDWKVNKKMMKFDKKKSRLFLMKICKTLQIRFFEQFLR